MAKKTGGKRGSKAGANKQPKGHAAPGKTEAGTTEARALITSVKQVKPIEKDGDPTLMARPELTEHGMTRKNAAAHHVQETPEDMQRAAAARGATNYSPGSGAQLAAEKVQTGQGITREQLQKPRPPAAERERVPAEQDQPKTDKQSLKDQEK